MRIARREGWHCRMFICTELLVSSGASEAGLNILKPREQSRRTVRQNKDLNFRQLTSFYPTTGTALFGRDETMKSNLDLVNECDM